MVRRLAALLAAAPLAVLLGLLSLMSAPAALAGDPCYHGFEIPPLADEATDGVKAMPCAFAPTIARIPVGGTVTFYNGDEFTHLVTGANQEWGSRDVELKPGKQVSYTFTTAGIYPYACALHRGMSGAIIVGDTTAAAGVVATATAPAAPAADAAALKTSSPGAESVLPAVVGGGAIAAVVAAALISRRRRPVAIR